MAMIFWLDKIAVVEQIILLVFAFCLPISHSVCSALWIVGFTLMVIRALLERAGKQSPLAGTDGTASDDTSTSKNTAASTPADETLSSRWIDKLPPLAIPIGLLIIAITMSGLVNGGAGEAFRSFRKILETLLPYFWAYYTCRRYTAARACAVLTLLWVSSIAGIYGSIQQIFDYHPTKFKYLQGTGFLAHPMAFAGQMQVFSMLALGLLLSSGYKKLSDDCPDSMRWILANYERMPLFIILVVCNFAGLFFALERSAWIGGAAGAIAIAAVCSLKWALAALLGLFASGGVAYILSPAVAGRISALFSGNDPSVKARLKIWSECINHYFASSPVFGIGWLKFPHFDIPEAIVPGVSKDLNHAHSNYVHFLTTTGIIGLLSYIIFLFWTFSKSLRSFYRNRLLGKQFNSGLALGVFGTAVALAISGIFEFNFGASVQVRLAQWFVLALLI